MIKQVVRENSLFFDLLAQLVEHHTLDQIFNFEFSKGSNVFVYKIIRKTKKIKKYEKLE